MTNHPTQQSQPFCFEFFVAEYALTPGLTFVAHPPGQSTRTPLTNWEISEQRMSTGSDVNGRAVPTLVLVWRRSVVWETPQAAALPVGVVPAQSTRVTYSQGQPMAPSAPPAPPSGLVGAAPAAAAAVPASRPTRTRPRPPKPVPDALRCNCGRPAPNEMDDGPWQCMGCGAWIVELPEPAPPDPTRSPPATAATIDPAGIPVERT